MLFFPSPYCVGFVRKPKTGGDGEAYNVQVCWENWEGVVLSNIGWCSDGKSIFTSFIKGGK